MGQEVQFAADERQVMVVELGDRHRHLESGGTNRALYRDEVGVRTARFPSSYDRLMGAQSAGELGLGQPCTPACLDDECRSGHRPIIAEQ